MYVALRLHTDKAALISDHTFRHAKLDLCERIYTQTLITFFIVPVIFFCITLNFLSVVMIISDSVDISVVVCNCF